MVYSQQLASYTVANETVQKTRQLVMLYDAVIRFLKQARVAMEERRFEERMNLIQKASNIIIGLHKSVDFERGGEIAQTLNNFYIAMDLRMLNLNRSNSLTECDGILSEIKMMRDAWDKIDNKLNEPIGKADLPADAEKPVADFSA